MIISETWLREYVDPSIEAERLAEQMTMAGLEVESLNKLSGEFENVVVAEIVSVDPHPNADKLRVCEVDVGKDEHFSVVCGAPNAQTGVRVPYARVGAVLPDGIKIKSTTIRGVESAGMLCAENELGISELDDGLMELSSEAPLGIDLKTYLDLEDNLFELGLTPNRADCLSIVGVARDVAALNDLKLKEVNIPQVDVLHFDKLNVRLDSPEFCPIYLGRIIHGADLTKPTPVWIRERLRRCGIRSINAAVDITNYVMLELGQPMHAFDFEKLAGEITVRNAKDTEELCLLNGSIVSLNAQTTLIADSNGPLALAGIMGGEESSVTEGTSSIFLESAYFVPEKIAGKARSYGLHTDSSHRFERGVDVKIQREAIERATQLLLDIVGGQAGVITDARAKDQIPGEKTVSLRETSITRMLGFKMSGTDVERILFSLGLELTANNDGWHCVVPSWRFDISEEADLLEELARVYGYNNLPVVRIKSDLKGKLLPESRLSIRRIRRQLVALGYHEAITFSFQNPTIQEKIDPKTVPFKLVNPISEDLSVMRTSVVPGLLQALVHNFNRQRQRISLFETGLVFIPNANQSIQVPTLGMVFSGRKNIEGWANESRQTDFFDVKGDLEEVLALTGRSQDFSFIADSRSGFHPGRTARIEQNGQRIGWLGAIHPELLSSLGIEIQVIAVEIKLDAILSSSIPEFEEVSRYPEIRRDLAFLIDKTVTAEEILCSVRSSAGEYLIDLTLFDVYSGEGIDPKRKSVAVGLTFCDSSSTLEDVVISKALDRVVDSLRESLGAELR